MDKLFAIKLFVIKVVAVAILSPVSISASQYNDDIVLELEERNPRKARACRDKSIGARCVAFYHQCKPHLAEQL